MEMNRYIKRILITWHVDVYFDNSEKMLSDCRSFLILLTMMLLATVLSPSSCLGYIKRGYCSCCLKYCSQLLLLSLNCSQLLYLSVIISCCGCHGFLLSSSFKTVSVYQSAIMCYHQQL